MAAKESARELAKVLVSVGEQDRDAFETLYTRTNKKLYGVVRTIIYRDSIADEVLQDVFFIVWERAAEYRPDRGLAITWMATIARNCAVNELRRMMLRPVTAVPDKYDVASPSLNALEEIEHSDTLKALLTCLAKLEAAQREIILLAYYRGFSRKMLAERYDKPVATVKTLLRRGLNDIRLCMERRTSLPCADGGCHEIRQYRSKHSKPCA